MPCSHPNICASHRLRTSPPSARLDSWMPTTLHLGSTMCQSLLSKAQHIPEFESVSKLSIAVADPSFQNPGGSLALANPHVRPLKDALEAAKSKSKVPPVAERVEACKKFLERAKRRSSPPPELVGADCRAGMSFENHSPGASLGTPVLTECRRKSRSLINSTICPYELGRGG